ncbi:MAG: NADH-quinone oxidoreductase subunit NuoB [Thermoplasmata archaeon]
MKSWLRRSFERGILTTRYPAVLAREEEIPETGRAPERAPDSIGEIAESVRAACPTRAIGPTSIDQGKCVRCARCHTAGLIGTLDPRASVGSRASLIWPTGRPTADAQLDEGPLAPLGRSLHVFMIDVGSCQACNYEVLGLVNPYYDLHRLGIFFTNSPRHADVLVVVGVPTPEMADPLRRTFEAIPAPKAVLAVGACAIDGGVFANSPAVTGTVAEIVPVDRYVAGCPPPPLAILEGLLTLGRRSSRTAAREGRR